MRALRSVALAAVVLLVGLVSTSSAQVRLRLQFPENQEIRHLTQIQVDQVLSINGQDVPTKSEQNIRSRTSVGARRPDGSLPLTQRIEGLKLHLELPGGITADIDADDKEAPKDELPQLKPIRDSLKALIGASYIVVLDKDGKVTGIEGAERALAARVDDLDPMVADALRKRFDPDRLKRESTDEFSVLPDRLLRPGDTWDRTEEMDLGGNQTMKFQRRCEYLGTVEANGRKLHKIGIKTTSVSYALDPTAGSPVQVSDSDLKIASSDGVILFDESTGQVVEQSLKMHITGDLTLVINTMKLPSKLDLKLETRTTVQGNAP